MKRTAVLAFTMSIVMGNVYCTKSQADIVQVYNAHTTNVKRVNELTQNSALLKAALDQGMDPNEELHLDTVLYNEIVYPGIKLNWKATSDITPLYLAVLNRNIESVKILLAYGANPNYIFKGNQVSSVYGNWWHETALYCAMRNQDYDIVIALLDAHADPHFAKREGNSRVSTRLTTPLSLVSGHNAGYDQKMIDILRAYGAIG